MFYIFDHQNILFSMKVANSPIKDLFFLLNKIKANEYEQISFTNVNKL